MVVCTISFDVQIDSFKRASLYTDPLASFSMDEIRARSVTITPCFPLPPPRSLEPAWFLWSLLR
jgi:hypothetical protein